MNGVVSMGGLLLAGALAISPLGHAVVDDFEDGDPLPYWEQPDVTFNSGALAETNGRLEYTASPPTFFDDAFRVWAGDVPTYGGSWRVEVELTNTAVLGASGQLASNGIEIGNLSDPNNDFLFAEIYASSLNRPDTTRGYYGQLGAFDPTGANAVDSNDASFELGATEGALRVEYNPTTHLIALSYNVDPQRLESAWVQYGSFSISGDNPSADVSVDWQMSEGDRFYVLVYGNSQNQGVGADVEVTSGQMFFDNFELQAAETSKPSSILKIISILKARESGG